MRLGQITFQPGGKSIVARALTSRDTVHLPDIALDPYYAAKDARGSWVDTEAIWPFRSCVKTCPSAF